MGAGPRAEEFAAGLGCGGCPCLRTLDALAPGKVSPPPLRIILRYHSLHMASVFDIVVAIEADRGSS